MTRSEFLDTLRRRLAGMPEAEADFKKAAPVDAQKFDLKVDA